jgi:uncharacterized protein YfdQ (DUF2303 family)
MDEKTINLIDQSRIGAKEMALPAGGWDTAPFAGDALIAHQDYVLHTEAPLRYKFEDIASFTAYCAANVESGEGEGIILYTNRGLAALHNWLQPAGNKVHYNFELSPELLAWKQARNCSHKGFRKFLEERLDELVDATIFQALATLKMNTNITFQSDFDDDNNFGFIYEEKEGRGNSKIPKEFTIKVPFFANNSPQEIPLRLSVSQPKDPGSKPLFTIEIIREERLLFDNVAKLIMDLRRALPDHMILHGSSTS